MHTHNHAIKTLLWFFVILGFSAYFRFTGINWDQNQHLHPDERFLTSVTTNIQWPTSWAEFFNTDSSPLNPQNQSHSFYVYGTFPLFLVKAIAELVKKTDYNSITLLGRIISGLLELGAVIFVYATTRKITQKNTIALLAMFMYGLFITPIQSAHYFTVDAYVGFFLTLSLYFIASTPRVLQGIFLGLSFGLALASKISAVYLLWIIIIGYCLYALRTKQYKTIVLSFLFFCLTCATTVRIAQPYLFTGPAFWNIEINPKILANWKELEGANSPGTYFPPALQWIPTKPYSFHIIHQSVWAIGLPITLTAIISIIVLLLVSKKLLKISIFRKIPIPLYLLSLWTLTLWIYQGAQFAKPLRYLYPVHSAMSIIFGFLLYYALASLPLLRFKKISIIGLFCFISLWWTYGLTSFYRKPQPRVTASEWILNTLAPGSKIGFEHWDDPAPLHVPAHKKPEDFTYAELTLYHNDTEEKWKSLSEQIAQTDYIIMTSNRLWRSLPAIPDRYPHTARYYALLTNGTLGFEPIAVFSSYPCFIGAQTETKEEELLLHLNPPPVSLISTSYCALGLNDDGAEESFTVYDHPKVIIYENITRKSAQTLYSLIMNL